MKDFYDLWYLSHIFSFDGPTLRQALQATFERRGGALSHRTGLPIALTDAFRGECGTGNANGHLFPSQIGIALRAASVCRN